MEPDANQRTAIRPRRALALVLVLVLATSWACGGAPEEQPVRIAFLRAVANPQSPTEAGVLAELEAAGFGGNRLILLGAEEGEAYPDPDSATEAVRGWAADGVDLILAFSTSGAVAARDAAPDTNVIFISNDPTAAGLVADESRPEGRLTGVTFRVPADRTLDIGRRTLPGLERLGLVYPPQDPAAVPNRDAFADAARELGMELQTEGYSTQEDIEPAVGRLAGEGVQALVASTSPTGTRNLDDLAAAARLHRLPVIANTDLAAFALIALYPDGRELGRQMGRQAIRLLQGAEPSSVPVEDPQRFDLVLNEITATELGIAIPEAVQREADLVRR